ncbi:MAG: hypothetical protein AAF466_06205 [Bacteroidota bacterium]
MAVAQQHLKDILYSGPLSGIKLFQVNDNFFELFREGYWIIDGGIELTLPGGVVSAAWNSNLEMFTVGSETVANIYGQDNLIQLENERIATLDRFLGSKIVEVELNEMEFEYVADYTMRVEKEQQVVEIICHFDDNTHLQIAFIEYSLEENKAPTNFSFDLYNDILISIKHIFEIGT